MQPLLSYLLMPTTLIPHLPPLSFLLLPAFLFCLAASFLYIRNLRRPAAALPPGPPPLPIIGHLHLLGALTHQSFHHLSQVYGPLMSLRLGSIPVIVASTPAMAREILQTQDHVFASRSRTAATVHTLFDGSDIAFAPYGPYWRRMRQLCVTELFSKTRLESFGALREEETALLILSILEDSTMGREVPVLSRLRCASNNIISRLTLGQKYSELVSDSRDATDRVVNLLNEWLYLLAVFNVGDFIPYVQWMDLQGYVKRMKVVGETIRTTFREIIDDRRQLRREQPSSPKDLLDVLLSVVAEEIQPDVPITDDNIKAVLLDIFGGGTDTTSVTTEWAMSEILSNATCMKELHAELDSVVGKGRLMEESDIAQLPYLRAVVKETMRLHPAVPLLVPHESTEACEIAGYRIPAKTRAYVNVWAIGRDPSSWPERPLEFWPERFLGSDVDLQGQHFELLPFGSGRRGCPGWRLGLLNVQVILGRMMQAFEWSLAGENGSGLDMTESEGLTAHRASPLLARASPRLPQYLYHQNLQ